MNLDQLVNVIKNVASEQQYEIEGGEKTFYVYIDRYHAVAFELIVGAKYIEVSQWEDETAKTGKYGRAIYSLRNYSDAVHFCSIMISSATIRAKKNLSFN